MDENNNLFRVKFGERVKISRDAIGMTQEELAERLGYKHKTSVSKIEKGLTAVPNTKIVEIAQALNVTIPYLMGRETNNVNSIKLTFNLTEEESSLLSAWHKATHDEKMQIYFALKKYGMPEPLKEDTSSSESLSNAG